MPKCLDFFILFCLSSALARAQEGRRIRMGLADTTFIREYITATDNFDKSQGDSIVKRYQYASVMSRSVGYHEATAYCFMKLGFYYFDDQPDYPRSRAYLYNAIPYCKHLKKDYYWLVPYIYNLLGATYFNLGHHDSAMLYYNRAIRVIDSLPMPLLPAISASIYGNIGSVLAASHQFQQGIHYIQKSLTLNLKNKKPRQKNALIALNYANLASLHSNNQLSNKDSADYYWEMAARLYRELGMRERLQYVYASRAGTGTTILFRNIGIAERYLDTAIRIDPEAAQNHIAVQSSLTSLYYYKGAYADAIRHGQHVLKLCDSIGMRERKRDVYEILAYAYIHLGDTLHSHQYQRRFKLLSDSLLNEEITRSIGQMEVRYRIADKDKALAENKAALYRQRSWLIGSISFGLILLLSLLAFLRSSREKRRLHREQLQNLQQQQKIAHLQVKMNAEEQERKRIARELHDGLGVLLSAAKINHALLGKVLAPACSDVFAYRQSKDILEQMQQEIRIIAHNLVPDYITHKSFEEALATLAKKFNDPGVFAISVYSYGQLRNLHPERSFALYRVIEEIMHNAVKHSGGKELTIQLMYHQDQLHITIEDNGKGFDTDLAYMGMGLHNIRTRVALLKGLVNLSSAKDQGTTYTLEVPY